MALSVFKSGSKRLSKKVIISLKHKINANPKLKEQILFIFKPFPKLKSKIKGIEALTDDAYRKMYRFNSYEQLPVDAQKIYSELKKAVENPKRVK